MVKLKIERSETEFKNVKPGLDLAELPSAGSNSSLIFNFVSVFQI